MDMYGLLLSAVLLLLALIWGYPRIRGYNSPEFAAFSAEHEDTYLIVTTAFPHLGHDVLFYAHRGRRLTRSVDKAGRFSQPEASRFISAHAGTVMISETDVLEASYPAASLAKLRDPILRAAMPEGSRVGDTSSEPC